MKNILISLGGVALLCNVLIACSSGSSGGGGSGTYASGGTVANNTLKIVGNENNIVPVTIGCNYMNEPCVSVTVCEHNSTNCKTINNILLDTGSFGLRVFKSQLTGLNLTASTDLSGNTYAECVGYLDGTSQWGSVNYADIKLGGLTASNVPMQVIDASFPTSSAVPTSCTSPESSSSDYNGILGIGLFVEDCGTSCATSGNNMYFACSGSSCSSAGVATVKQVSNPIAFLGAGYNNGSALQLPGLESDYGAISASGYLVLGIATATNNTLDSAPNVFQADSNGNFTTVANSHSYTAFIDSGSNGLFIPQVSAALSVCSGWYCPSSTLSLTATQAGVSSSAQASVIYKVASASILFNTQSMVFNDLGGELNTYFDWGLPFFLGRTIFTGIDGKTSTYGTGPYWAY